MKVKVLMTGLCLLLIVGIGAKSGESHWPSTVWWFAFISHNGDIWDADRLGPFSRLKDCREVRHQLLSAIDKEKLGGGVVECWKEVRIPRHFHNPQNETPNRN